MPVDAGSQSLAGSDLALFEAGRHPALYRLFGGRLLEDGARFRVWAPRARSVQVVGEFDGWGAGGHHLEAGAGGVWSGFVPEARAGQLYKYRLLDAAGRRLADKADPFATATEAPPGNASMLSALDYEWHDHEWLAARAARQAYDEPVSIYELHLGSWDEGVRYRDLAEPLADYVLALGFTHVELLPVTEHPFYGSWGYQATGYFAPTARYGSPEDLMQLIDSLHQRGIGVLLDWTPAHFADDDHALPRFDGEPLFEHPDPRRARHAAWGTLIFNYERAEVRSFLLSSACSWLDRYHVDGLRVDAVSSMLYRDFARPDDWVPNEQGGPEDGSAAELLRELNATVHARFPGAQTYAEEPRGWPGVTRPVATGGLGFDFKWDLGWTGDTLAYLARDPSERPAHHEALTFRQLYASGERYLLPLSHDVVANERGSLLEEFPGSEEERFATLRLLLGYQLATPGRKLLFMGTELAPWTNWHHDRPLDWSLVLEEEHSSMARWVRALNFTYAAQPALHASDFTAEALRWVVVDDAAHSTVAFLRDSMLGGSTSPILVVANFSSSQLAEYCVGVPAVGPWSVLLDSDATRFGGKGGGPAATLEARAEPLHEQPASLNLRVAPLSVVFLVPSVRPTE